LIKATDPFSKQTKDLDRHVVQAFNDIVNLTLSEHTNAMNPFQELNDPPQGWPLRGLVDLVWHGCVIPGSLLAQSTLRHRIHHEGSRHHHQ
jgi:hypothetical protein